MRSREPYHCWGNRCQGVIVVARLRKLSGSRQLTTDCRLTHTSTDCGRVVGDPDVTPVFPFGIYFSIGDDSGLNRRFLNVPRLCWFRSPFMREVTPKRKN